MMVDLIFASNNEHKVYEIQASIGSAFNVISLKEAGIFIDIPEPFESVQENASEKSKVISELTGKNCFSEDTGLEVDVLHGAPGVHSARYAGEQRDPAQNILKLLNELADNQDRRARFRTVISLRYNGKEHLFEGMAEGNITLTPRGNSGFGYDPVFVPLGSNKTFGEMTVDEKAQYSHRRKAATKLVLFLRKQRFSAIPADQNEKKTL